ncbi:MAG: Ethanolamine utilization protein EutD [Elusimicrobia bacterium]|nr:Ethanolamine utilization protein EutD [Elusimicrobiota bacterium]
MNLTSPFWSKLESSVDPSIRIGFSDSNDPRILEAIQILKDRKLVHPIPISNNIEAQKLSRYKDILRERQKRLSLSDEVINNQLSDSLYIGVCQLLENEIDGLVAGSLRPTSHVVKAAIQCIGPKPGVRLISGQFMIESPHQKTRDNTPFLFADCAVIPEPSPRALASVALSAAESYRFFTEQLPKVAFLSFSTRDSAQHPLVDRIKEALEITRKQDANLAVDGELQADAALDPEVALIKKANESKVAGQANVFIFPTLEAGNIAYKLVQRFSMARTAGPLLWGLGRPMSDLSRGCNVQEIIDTTLLVSMIAKRKE